MLVLEWMYSRSVVSYRSQEGFTMGKSRKRKTTKTRMGRPPLPKGEKKRHLIPFKVDDDELKALDRKAGELGVSRSELIRDAIERVICGGVQSLSRGGGGRVR